MQAARERRVCPGFQGVVRRATPEMRTTTTWDSRAWTVRRVVAGAAVAVCVWGVPGSAQEATVAVRLEVWSPSGCPGSADFVRAVGKRHVHVRLVGRDERAVTVDVLVAPASEGVLGRLVLVDADGRRSERTVTTANCGQASEALALVAALALRQSIAGDLPAMSDSPSSTPATGTDSSTATVPSGSTPPAASSASSPSGPLPSAEGRTSPSPSAPELARAVVPVEGPSETTSSTPRRSWTFDASAAGFGVTGTGPDVVAGGALRVGAMAPWRGSPWTPSLRIAVEDTLDESVSGSLGTATFGMVAVSAELCPWAFFGFGAGSFRPCASGEAGVLRAAGSGTTNPRSEPRLWTAAGIEGILAAPIAGPIFWDVTLGALVALDRYRFMIGPGTIFETPAVVARLALGIGAKID